MSAYRNQLLTLLHTRFNLEELKDLCFYMDIDAENIAAQGPKSSLARGLIEFCERHGYVEILINQISHNRKDLSIELSRIVAVRNYPLEKQGMKTPLSWPRFGMSGAGTLPSKSYLPYFQNDIFIGRQQELLNIANAFQNHRPSTNSLNTAIVVISGLIGIGKTELAKEFAYRYGRYFVGGVYWINCAAPASIATQVAKCGRIAELDIPAFGSLSVQAQASAVISKWEESIPRLLVFDNCENEDQIREWLPRTGGCCVLITSRRAYWEPTLGKTILTLENFSDGESVEFLQQLASRLPEKEAKIIVSEVGNNPLVLFLVGKNLERLSITSARLFVKELRSNTLVDNISAISPLNSEFQLERAFQVSYNAIDSNSRVHAAARHLLIRASYLAPYKAFSASLLLNSLGWNMNELSERKFAENGLRLLINLGLLQEVDYSRLQVHPLLASFLHKKPDILSFDKKLEFLDHIIRHVDSPYHCWYFIDKRIENIMFKNAKTLPNIQKTKLTIRKIAIWGRLIPFDERALNELRNYYAKIESLLKRLVEQEAPLELQAQLNMQAAGITQARVESIPDSNTRRNILWHVVKFYQNASIAAEKYGKNLPLRVTIQKELGYVYALLANWNRAQRCFATAVNILEENRGKFNSKENYARYYSRVFESTSMMYWYWGKELVEQQKDDAGILNFSLASEEARKAIKILEANVEEDTWELALNHQNLGDYLLEVSYDNLELACTHWRKALEISMRIADLNTQKASENQLDKYCKHFKV